MGRRANRQNRRDYNRKIQKIEKTARAQEQEQFSAPPIISIPTITGAKFDTNNNSVQEYELKLQSLPITDYKRRILFITEASYLHTGFSTYLREVFKRLYATGKFELAEFGSYGAPKESDKRAQEIPWKYYHNLPANPMEEAEYGTQNGQPINNNYKENQFGKWRLSYVLADFKPDIIICHRDHWMDHFIGKSPFRGNFTWLWMPTVDGYPQKWEWLKDYATVDGLFAYSHFGKRVLEEQSQTQLAQLHKLPNLKVLDVCQPGVDTAIFKPIDKQQVRDIFHIPAEMRFAGTVMRNQPRKLFPRIIDAFYTFKTRYLRQSKNVFLLLHTSIPDVGWDIPEAIYRRGLQQFVVFTYICHSCGNFGLLNFVGSPAKCPVCGQQTFYTPNTQFGLDDDKFNLIYNIMDVYIQGSIAEGDGMPVNEARACGVPCLVSDFSALYEKARNGGALPIKSNTLYTEHETMQWRDLFDPDDLAANLAYLFGNEYARKELAFEARKCASRYYSWDLTAKKWEYWLSAVPIKDRNKTWGAPIELKSPDPESPPPDLSNEDFIEWCYKHILCRSGVDPGGMQYWVAILTQGAPRQQIEAHFRKLIDEENITKQTLLNPNISHPDPVTRVSDIIKRTEGNL